MYMSFLKKKVWLLLPACACMFSLLADDSSTKADTNANTAPAHPDCSKCKSKAQADKSTLTANCDKSGNDNPNDPTQPQQTVAVADAEATSQNDSAQTISINAAITANNDAGASIVFDNGMTFEVPMVLRKKSSQWSVGDKVLLEAGKRDAWYKLTNSKNQDVLRARLMAHAQK